MSILNISAYKFVGLDGLDALRARMVERCTALALKGTILLAPEGINLFLAAPRDAIDAFVSWLHEDPRFADITPKESISDDVPFGRMRVRLKKEIITMRAPSIRPGEGRAPHVLPLDLRRWLDQGHDDEGRPVVLVDTRNDYEVAAGTFENTVEYGLSSFTGFPAAIAADRARFDGKTVVSFCTGGIRCEKAAIHMREIGIDHVVQLDGGILNYFQSVEDAGRDWLGECFVFDNRIALNTGLHETTTTAGQVFDAAHPDEAWRLQRARRLENPGG